MSLLDLFESAPEQLQEKTLHQIIAFAGKGDLRDGGSASAEFREYLRNINSPELADYARQCLVSSFKGSGFALQDIVNEVGHRLGFRVRHGRYRGTTSSEVGFDGVWVGPDNSQIVVEVKTTDTYSIQLDKIAGYRRQLIEAGSMSSDRSSILIVVGRDDTGSLEAQIRGSRYAWDVRLISVEALLRLISIKEEVEDPETAARIRAILHPREYTRVDAIIDLVFSAKEDIVQDGELGEDGESETDGANEKKFTPVSFHDACIKRISKVLNRTLVKQSKATFQSPNETVAVVCAVSRQYEKGSGAGYWFAFHPHQKEFLESAEEGYVAFGCGSSRTVLLIPLNAFSPLLPLLNQTTTEDRSYWHVQIHTDGNKLVLYPKAGAERRDLTDYLIPIESETGRADG